MWIPAVVKMDLMTVHCGFEVLYGAHLRSSMMQYGF